MQWSASICGSDKSPSPDLFAVPILAITASEYDLTEEKARALGFSGYLLKPLEPDVFKKKLDGLSNDV